MYSLCILLLFFFPICSRSSIFSLKKACFCEIPQAIVWRADLCTADLKWKKKWRGLGYWEGQRQCLAKWFLLKGLAASEVWGYRFARQNLKRQKIKRKGYSYSNWDKSLCACADFNYGRYVYLCPLQRKLDRPHNPFLRLGITIQVCYSPTSLKPVFLSFCQSSQNRKHFSVFSCETVQPLQPATWCVSLFGSFMSQEMKH